MNELVKFIKDRHNNIDPIILAGIFHKQFILIHPFMDGNGRTARLVTKVLLAKMGLNTFNLFSFENYYNQNVSKYFEFVGELGDYYELVNNVDFTKWLEYFTGGIIDELLRVKRILNLMEGRTESVFSNDQKILDFIGGNGQIKNSDYAKLVKNQNPQEQKIFKDLLG